MRKSVVYYADPTAADQGAAGTRTIKGLMTAIGSTKQATIVLAHTSSSTNTTYTVSTDLTVSSNITVKVDRGALVSIASGKTLTITGTLDAGLYQIFSGAGTVTVNTSTIYPDWWGGKGDDSTDSTSALQAALNNLSVGRKLVIGDGKWHFSSSLTWLGNSTEVECRGVLVYDGTDASTAITIGSSDEPRMMKGNIKLIDGNGTDWSVQKTGVETIDLLYADLRFDIGNIGDEIGGFYTGLKVTASTGNGNVYNNYRLGTIYDNKRGIVINSEGTGWVNENIFYQGSFSVKSAVHVGDLADTYYVYIPSSTNSPNNNRFIAPSFEGDDVYCWFYNNGPYQLLFYPRMEGSPTYKIYNDTGGIYSRIVLNYVSGIYSNPNNGISDASGSMYINDRVSQTVGRKRYYSTTAEPTVGTFMTGDILHNYNPSYGAWSHKTCISSGTYSSASDSTGDTDGSTAVITGMADTSDFYIGEYVTVSAGLPSATTAYKILAKTDSSITLNTNSNSVQSNVTVATVDPVWAVTSVAQADNTVQSITYASEIAPDLSLGHILQVAQLTGNIKINNPTNTFAGQRFSVRLLADGTGRSITYGTYFKAATTSLTANKRIILDFLVIATNQIVQINTPIECN